MYDAKGKLTRQGAEQVIREGGSVLLGGKLHTKLDTLPDEATFAKGDTASEERARQSLLEQQAVINRQLAALGPSAGLTSTTGVQSNPDAGKTNAGTATGTGATTPEPEPQFAGKPLSFYDQYATVEQLDAIPGVGAATAKQILEARAKRDAGK